MNTIDNEKMKGNSSEQTGNSADMNENSDHLNEPGNSAGNRGTSSESGDQSQTQEQEQNSGNKKDDEAASSDQAGHEAADEKDEKIAQLEEELQKTRDSMLRKAAEFENLKRRTQKEKEHIYDEARAASISKFLSIREDLKRSIELSREKNVDKGFHEGLKMLLNNFDRILEEYNVEPVEETGVPFDVDMHDAMLTQPAEDDSVESNTVLQVLEPGYMMGDRVIKHAKVIVSQ